MALEPIYSGIVSKIVEEVTAATEGTLGDLVADAEAAAAAAAASVGAVKQLVEFALQPDAGLVAGAWYGKFFVPVGTTFTLLRVWIYQGTGTCSLYVNVNDNNVAGPVSVTTTSASSVINIPVLAGQRISFQLANLSGSPLAIAVQMEGLPT